MLDKLEAIQDRYYYLEEQLSDPETMGDMDKYKNISKEYKNLKEVVNVYRNYKELLGNIETAKEMLKEEDKEMKEMAQMELEELNPQKNELEEKLKILLIPKDPEDERDVIFEIRSGTGGDEASIFAGDLYRMYSKFFEHKKYKVEILNINEGSVGGYNKIVLEVNGENVFGTLKFESGAHRVQRVPKTESQGRVHTSAATIVVMPKLIMEDININKSDLRVDTFRSSGAGGQHVNKTESGVRFTHLPTGIVAESTDGRSQIRNREIAIQRLYQKIYEAQRTQHESKVAAARRSLVGSGDRSEKVRTYNYPQNRVTDHRINLTLYSLDKIMEGNIEEIIEALSIYENAEKMKEHEE
ncbi:MAG: peptide chain release factor 1 [Bacteroidetes bacterium]|jgi:peptide chain release factor 1|nr:peptide chain release factor 1 [Bacteroidota bacterium]MDF1863458.1 peptide chain release factor 1 [Saprospiraceae bacterium]